MSKFKIDIFNFPRFCFDFGTNFVRIGISDKGVIQENNVIAHHIYRDKYLFYGKEAKELIGKTPKIIKIIHPVQKGVINDFDAFYNLLSFIKEDQLLGSWANLKFAPYFSYAVVGIPNFATEIEQRASKEVLQKLGFNQVFLVPSAIACAASLVDDLFVSKPFIILDLGAGKVEVSIISKGGVVLSRYLDFGGFFLDERIRHYLHLKYAVAVGYATAERLKIELLNFNNSEKQITVKGKALDTGLPKEIKVKTSEILEALYPSITRIVDEVKNIIEESPPEIVEDITTNGVYLVGGLSFIDGLDKFLSDEVKVKVNKVDNPTRSQIDGLLKIAKSPQLLRVVKLPDV
ncbi:MAG: rod shape-determining protein [Patescibacteria group bacterium]|nr:MAG: rod shape-determining protein [Patescibacteria group bacterium]